MKSVVIVMLLLGCDCDGMQCRPLQTVSAGWTSLDACRADMARQITSQAASYPVLSARCSVQAEAVASALPKAGEKTASPVAHEAGRGQDANEAGGLLARAKLAACGFFFEAELPKVARSLAIAASTSAAVVEIPVEAFV